MSGYVHSGINPMIKVEAYKHENKLLVANKYGNAKVSNIKESDLLNLLATNVSNINSDENWEFSSDSIYSKYVSELSYNPDVPLTLNLPQVSNDILGYKAQTITIITPAFTNPIFPYAPGIQIYGYDENKNSLFNIWIAASDVISGATAAKFQYIIFPWHGMTFVLSKTTCRTTSNDPAYLDYSSNFDERDSLSNFSLLPSAPYILANQLSAGNEFLGDNTLISVEVDKESTLTILSN